MTSPPAVYQRRWLAWCRSTRRDPAETGVGYLFVAWMGLRWAEWDRLNGRRPGAPHDDADHAAFDLWLSAATEVERAALDGGEVAT